MARTVGVEEEMLLVDVRNGRPRSVSGQLVLRAAMNEQPVAGLGVRGALEGEFQQQMIETHTAPVESFTIGYGDRERCVGAGEIGEVRGLLLAQRGDLGCATG